MPRFPILFMEFLKINCNYLEDSSLLGCGAMYMHQNNLLQPSAQSLPEKLTDPQLLKKFPTFYGTQRSITVFKRSLPPVPTLSKIDPVHVPPQSLRFILILSSHLCLGLPNGLLHSSFPTKSLNALLLSPLHATFPAHLSLLDLITRMIPGEEYRA